MERDASLPARLAKLGFTDTAAVAEALAAVPAMESRLELLRSAGNPDAAVSAVARIATSGAVDAASWSNDQWRRLGAVTGASTALADFLVRHPQRATQVSHAHLLPTAEEMTASLRSCVQGKDWDNALAAMRVEYRSWVACIAAVDVTAEGTVILPAVAHALTDLADAVMSAALDCARAAVPGAADIRLAVVAMGKCGAGELNYVSDVDVMFVAEHADETTSDVARLVMRACSQPTSEGSIWEVDAALRPEGKAGALVRTLDSYVDYYERWAESWEYQALLKARPMAGDSELGTAFVDAVHPFVWQAASRPGFVESVQSMRERVTDLIPAKDADRELKLGRGGLRDVEFAVQLLQLVHGRSDALVRSPNTLLALEALSAWGYVGRGDGRTLDEAYRFLRTLEHRIQLARLRRTHSVPTDLIELRRLGRSMGLMGDPADELVKQWRKHAHEVRRIHEKLFYRPLLDAVARLSSEDARLTQEAAGQRLAALGFADSEGALRHLEALTSGVSRRAVIQRTLLPVMLEWFAQSPDPDAALLGFRRVSESLGETPWYLRLLRDESATAERLAALLGTSRYATDLLLRSPESVALLSDEAELLPRSAADLRSEAAAITARNDSAEDAVVSLRAMRRRELLRVAAGALVGATDGEGIGVALTAVTDATIQGALESVCAAVGDVPPMVVVAMGRYGGVESGFGSDADVMFCYDDTAGGHDQAHSAAQELRRLLMEPSTDPELVVDADLRPEGKGGPLVRSLASFAEYYARWSSGWESQALLRARVCAGDPGLASAFVDLIDPIRYSEQGLADSALIEIRRLKARMEAERLPRGVDPAMHLKLGPGGLSDVEWVAQVLQMQHGHCYTGLRTTRTLPALRAAADAGLVDQADVNALSASWLMASRIRDVAMLLKGRPTDVVPADIVDVSRLAHAMGYGPRQGQHLRDDYLRVSRRSRAVVMRLLYGQDPAARP